MNFKILFLFIMLISLFKDILLSFLNKIYLHLHTEVPEEFKDIIGEVDFQKSIRYSIEKENLRLFRLFFSIPAYVFLYLLFVPKLERVTLTFNSEFLRIYFLLLAVETFLLIIILPFDIYSEFFIEKRFGFSTKTFRLYVLDFLKLLFLDLVILFLVSLALTLFDPYKFVSWVLFFTFTAIILVFIEILYPSIILRLFNKVEPIREGSLKAKISEIANKAHIFVSQIFVIDASKRSKHTNAFITGFGKSKMIVLYDTLINKYSEDEVVAIFAHEAGHHLKNHTIKGLFFMLINSFIFTISSFILFSEVQVGILLGMRTKTGALIYIFSFFYYIFTNFEFVSSSISRKYEYEADLIGSKLTTPRLMIEALKKIYKTNLSNICPHPAYEFYYYTHPSPVRRIKALLKVL